MQRPLNLPHATFLMSHYIDVYSECVPLELGLGDALSLIRIRIRWTTQKWFSAALDDPYKDSL